ncbi:MAG: type I DNA topoisomerase [Nitrospirae bacterium]|nr:type I DNA topoisomerase [Nitrospirota bacterium]
MALEKKSRVASPKKTIVTQKKKTSVTKKTIAIKEDASSSKKNLVIVESPAKAKTINKILGSNFVVKATVGHIKDLPKNKLGFDAENGFIPEYVTIDGKEKIIKDLQESAKKASTIYLASDPDREGEAIAWHIAEIIKEAVSQSKKTISPDIYRVIFNEITARAVKEAIENPSSIDMNKVNAQQARMILDKLVGYGLSPFLWKKIAFGLSAGRVQSVALKLIVERQKEINAFNSEEYWSISAEFVGSVLPNIMASLHKYKGTTVIEKTKTKNNFLIKDESTAHDILSAIKNERYHISSIEKKLKKRRPYPPYITSTIQQDASAKLRFSAKQTMAVAQQLYQGLELGKMGHVGLITYMRTDSTRLAPEAIAWSRELISKKFGKEYLPEKPHIYAVKKSAQEAHEAIRPTYPQYEPNVIKEFLKPDQYKLYNLIWNRFLASQMEQAQLEQTSMDIIDSKEQAVFRASGTIIKFKGFLALYTDDTETDKDQAILPNVKEGEDLKLIEITSDQHFTQPPPKFSEASLVKALEEKGIGRPSTYAAILTKIEERKYVEKEARIYTPTELGVVVSDLLVDKFPDIINTEFTAKMEDDLDIIEEGNIVWNSVIKDFHTQFTKDLSAASLNVEKLKPADVVEEINCEKCGKPMTLKWGRNGKFLACSGYPQCKNAKPIDAASSSKAQVEVVETDEICDKCGSPMVIKAGRYGKFMACSNYPSCKNIKSKTTGVKCPEDGGDIIEKKSKRGIFYGCKNYPSCKFIINYKPINEKCPDCNAPFLLEKKNKKGDITVFCYNKECKFKVVRRLPDS